jgi:hypothetical protein
MSHRDKKIQFPWMPPRLTKFHIQRAAQERAGRPYAAVTSADIDAELAAVAQMRRYLMTEDQLQTVRLSALDRADHYCARLCDRALDQVDLAESAALCAKILAYEDLRNQTEGES